MNRLWTICLALLLAWLTAMPSLAQKRFPAPIIYFDGEVQSNNWLDEGYDGRRQWLEARQNPDIPIAILLRYQYWWRDWGGSIKGYWCIHWDVADKNGITKSKEYSWRMIVSRSNNRPPKYVGDFRPSYHMLKRWGKKGWQNLSAHNDRWYRWDNAGNLLSEYMHYWCGFDGKQTVRVRIQLIDQHGNPAGGKSKSIRFKLPKLSDR